MNKNSEKEQEKLQIVQHTTQDNQSNNMFGIAIDRNDCYVHVCVIPLHTHTSTTSCYILVGAAGWLGCMAMCMVQQPAR